MPDNSIYQIPLGVQYPAASTNPFNTLNTIAETQNRLNQNRLFNATLQAKQSIPDIMQSATDPQTGQVDPEKAQQALLTDPRTAGFGGAEYVNQLRQLELTKQQIANTNIDITGKILQRGADMFSSALALPTDKQLAFIDNQLPAVARLAPPGAARGIYDNLVAMRAALEGVDPQTRQQILQAYASQAGKTSDALAAIYSKGGQTPQQLKAPVQIGPTTMGTQEQFQNLPGTQLNAPVTSLPLSQRVAQSESAGNASARNPASSATGAHQFEAGTWSDLMKKHPELGLTPEGRLDPQQSDRAFQAYAQDNGMALSRAGLPVNDATIALAHRYGPQGATKILQASPDTPVEKVLSKQAVEANGLAGMKVGDLQGQAAQVAGGGQATAQSAPQGVQTKYTPEQEKYQQDIGTEAAKNKQLMDARVSSGSNLMMRLDEVRPLLSQVRTGGGAELYAKLAGIAQAIPGVPQWVVDGINRGNLGATQELQKFMVQQATEQLQQSLAGAAGNKVNQLEFSTFQQSNPNLTTDPRAIEKIYNFVTRVYQRDKMEQDAYTEKSKEPGFDPATWPNYWQNELIRRKLISPEITKQLSEAPAASATPSGSKTDKLKAIWGE